MDFSMLATHAAEFWKLWPLMSKKHWNLPYKKSLCDSSTRRAITWMPCCWFGVSCFKFQVYKQKKKLLCTDFQFKCFCSAILKKVAVHCLSVQMLLLSDTIRMQCKQRETCKVHSHLPGRREPAHIYWCHQPGSLKNYCESGSHY